MARPANTALAEEFSAVEAWWRDAGVHYLFEDAPTVWIADETEAVLASKPVAVMTRLSAPEPEPAPAIDPAALPRDLDTFREWWLHAPELDSGRISGRVPPRGNAGATLMVLVEEPEAADNAALLSGPQGRLLDAMLAAFGVKPGDIYLASALPRHLPMADWDEIARNGFGNALVRHIALVSPRRIMALGGNILPLVGNNLPKSSETSREFNHEGLSIPLFAGRGLAALLERPRWKAQLWRDWLDWNRTVPPA